MSEVNENQTAIDAAAAEAAKPRAKPGPKPGWREEKARAAAEAAAKQAADAQNATPGTANATEPEGADLGTIDLVATQPERSIDTAPAATVSTAAGHLGVFKLDPAAQIPEHSTDAAACQDIRAQFGVETKIRAFSSANREYQISSRTHADGRCSILIPPGSRVQMPTGLALDIPDGHKVSVFARSGLSLKEGLSLANGVAVIDSDYVGEVFVLLQNNADTRVEVFSGDRVAQIELVPVQRWSNVELATKPAKKGNRTGGLGSTKVA